MSCTIAHLTHPARHGLAGLAALLMLVVTTPTQAQLAEIWDGFSNHLVMDVGPNAHVEQSLDEFAGLTGSYSASAGASSSQGTVGAWILANHTTLGHITGPLVVHTLSTVGGSLMFSGPAPAELDFALGVRGSFGPIDVGGHTVESMLAVSGAGSNNIVVGWGGNLSGAQPTAGYHASGRVTGVSMAPTNITATLHIRKLVTPGETVTISSSLGLEITPTQGFFAEANFAHTAQLGIAMPAGWHFVPTNGTFMTEAPPIPEPATWSLWAAGLIALASARRARRLPTSRPAEP
jgi:hypothetical protein